MRKLLVLAYWYPPCVRWPTASRRMRGLTRYLPEHGWEPIVVAPDPRSTACECIGCASWDGRDPGPTTVHRVPVRSRPGVRLGRRLRRATGDAAGPDAPGADPGPAARVLHLAALASELKDDWVRSGEQVARQVATTVEVDAVLTTSGPFGSLRIGRRLQGHLGRPWLADLRDPFSTWLADDRTSRFAVQLGRRHLRRDLRRADVVTTVSEGIADLESARLSRRVEVVPSGWDPAEWDGVEPERPWGDDHVLVLTGSILPGALDPSIVLAGLREAHDRHGTRLHYYGRDGGLVRSMARDHGVDDLVEDHGFVPGERLRRLLLGADAIVLLTNLVGMTGVPSGRLYDAIASRRPVIAVPGTDPAVSRPLDLVGTGHAVPTPDDLVGAIGRAADTARPGDREVLGFSIQRAAARMAELLADVDQP